MGSYVRLLKRNANYRNLWLAQLISFMGDWFNLLAAATLIANLSGAGTAISYLFLARFMPLFFVSPFAGVVADRTNRRYVMVATDLLRAVTVLGFLTVRTAEQAWLFYALTLLQFVLSAFYTPAHRALLPMIVDEDDLVTANALDGFTWSSMLAVGALLGGIATALFGLTAAFTMDAASFVVSAWFVGKIVLPAGTDLGTESAPATGGGLFQFMDGLRYLRVRPFILGLTLVKAGGSLVWGGVNVLEVALAEQRFPIGGSGTLTLGLIYAITGLGTGFGPLLLRRYLGDGREGLLRGIGIGFGLLAAGVLTLGWAPALPWVGVGTLTRALGSGSLWVFSSALLQTLVQDRYRGRVFAFEFAALTLTQSISILWAGMAQDRWGLDVQAVFLWAGLVGLVVGLLWMLFQGRHMGQLRQASSVRGRLRR